jgi:hypothetical protein
MAVGTSCALAQWGVAGTLVGAGFFTITGIALAGAWWTPQSRGFPAALGAGTMVGFALTAVMGAVAALGVLGLLFLLPFLAIQPLISTVARSYVRDRFHAPGVPRRLGLEQLDDAALCRTWRESFKDVESASSPVSWIGAVEQRRRCLDELQRRSPEGVAAWLASGASAAGDPLPFLQDRLPPST